MSQQPEALNIAINALQCARHGQCDHAMADEAIAALRAQVERLQAACRSQTAESDPQAGLSLTGATQEAADTGADELRNALQCLLASGGAIAEATAGELQSAIADPQAAPIVKNQAAAVLRARAALAASTGANVDAGMVPMHDDAIGELAEKYATREFIFDYLQSVTDIVRDTEAHHGIGLTVRGIQASGGAE